MNKPFSFQPDGSFDWSSRPRASTASSSRQNKSMIKKKIASKCQLSFKRLREYEIVKQLWHWIPLWQQIYIKSHKLWSRISLTTKLLQWLECPSVVFPAYQMWLHSSASMALPCVVSHQFFKGNSVLCFFVYFCAFSVLFVWAFSISVSCCISFAGASN